ncbi:hypothetical protein [Streptomyces melanogenes]|uniref:hypothetical protein n=1 Tax=Streptomyces melanogenes TaxID=67326 RepID=UPI0037986F64
MPAKAGYAVVGFSCRVGVIGGGLDGGGGHAEFADTHDLIAVVVADGSAPSGSPVLADSLAFDDVAALMCYRRLTA